MPIYEFYCADCHTVFNFLARSPATERRPACPRCGRPELERRASRFGIVSARAGGEGEDADADADLPPGFDESRLERAMEALAGEAESLDEDDPRQVAHLMRRFYDATGLPLTGGVEEAIRRMEAGEDPEKIEEELGDVLEAEDPFGGEGGAAPGARLKALRRRLRPPAVDETLYEL